MQNDMDIFDFHKKSNVKLTAGVLLIAEPYLKDPGFARSVILLCEHGNFGTLGFVLNQPSANTVNMLLPEISLPGVSIYNGGPVQTDSLQIIHQLPEFLGGVEVLPGIYWGASYEELAGLCKSGIKVDPAHIRLFRGYSGWDAGQLDDELKQNSWITAPAGKEAIFSGQSHKLWEVSLKSLGGEFVYLANLPIDPLLN